MRLSVIPLSFLVGGVLLALSLWGDDPETASAPPPPAFSLQEICSIQQEAQRLEEVRQEVRRFSEKLWRTKSAVLEGTLSLPEAAGCSV